MPESQIEAAEVRDLPAIANYLGDIYAGQIVREFAARYYEWKYFDLEGRDTGNPSAWIASDERGISGFLGCMPFRLELGSRTVASAWICDWHIADRARGAGLGERLLRRAMDVVPSLACIDGTEAAGRVFSKCGFAQFVCGQQWLRVVKALAYEMPRREGLRKAWGVAHALAHMQKRRRVPVSELQLRRSSGGARMETVEARPGPVRTEGYLTWLQRSPAGTPVMHSFLNGRGKGNDWALLNTDIDRLGRKRGRILDLQSSRKDAWAVCAAHFANEGADYIEAMAPSSDEGSLLAAGFMPRKPVRFWIWNATGVAVKTENWKLGLIDKDNAFRGSVSVP